MTNVEMAFNALYEIESVSSTNIKKDIMLANKDNNILRNLFYWTYNPFYRYHIKKFEYEINEFENKKDYVKHIFEFKGILSDLNLRRITGNKSRDVFLNFLKRCDKHEQYWYTKVITRDLQIGVSVTTINKIWTDIISTFPVALAEKQNPLYYCEHFCLQDKYDGYRCLTDNYKEADMISRNGNDLNGYDEIKYIMENCFPKDYVYDGELISSNFKGTQNSAFRKGGGKKANYHIFDVLPRDDFYNRTGGMILEERQYELNKLFKFAQKQAERKGIDISCIIQVQNLMVGNGNKKSDIKLADELYADALERGLEGVIIKDLNSHYMVGKTYSSECIDIRGVDKYFSWQKRKPRDSESMVVLDVYEGRGQFEGILGGVIVDYIGSDGKHYEVGVGSGFNKSDRNKYWNNPNLIIGKRVEICYDVESEDTNGNKSMRFPVFKHIRNDE